jgi:hypothetical protein
MSQLSNALFTTTQQNVLGHKEIKKKPSQNYREGKSTIPPKGGKVVQRSACTDVSQ